MPIVAACLIVASMLANAAHPSTSPSASDKAKADWLFLEALRQKSLDNPTAYYSLLDRAYQLDTTQTYIGALLAPDYLRTGQIAKGYRMMNRHFAVHPEDYFESAFLAKVASYIGDHKNAINIWATLDSLYPNRLDVTLKHADAIANRRDSLSFRQAVDLINRFEARSGKNISLTMAKANYLAELEDSAALIDEARSYINYAPASPDGYTLAANVYQMFDDLDSALVYYDKAVEIDQDAGSALIARAEFHKLTGDSASYDADVFEALANTNLDSSVKNELLTDYVKDLYGDSIQYPRITRMFDMMTARNPHDARLRDLYGGFLTGTGQYTKAAEQFDIAIDLEPDDADRADMILSLYLSAHQPDTTIMRADQLIDRYPDRYYPHYAKALALLRADSTDSAFAEANKALELVDRTMTDVQSDITASIGDIVNLRGDTIGSFVYYQKAIDLNPDNSMALNNYAYFLSLLGKDLDKAEQMSYQAVLINPTSSTLLDTYAWVLFKQQNYKKAKEYIDRAISFLDDDSAEVLDHAGDIYFFNGEEAKAIDLWSRALAADPDNQLIQKKVNHKTYFSR